MKLADIEDAETLATKRDLDILALPLPCSTP